MFNWVLFCDLLIFVTCSPDFIVLIPYQRFRTWIHCTVLIYILYSVFSACPFGNTHDDEDDKAAQSFTVKGTLKDMLKTIEEINSDDVTCATSQRTGSSWRTAGSLRSTTSSATVLAHAKAQSLKTNIEFTYKEADLRHQEADLRRLEEDVANNLLLLGAAKDYAMAKSEAGFLELAVMKEISPTVQEELQPTADSAIRTYDYVLEHFLRSDKLEEPETKCDNSNEKMS